MHVTMMSWSTMHVNLSPSLPWCILQRNPLLCQCSPVHLPMGHGLYSSLCLLLLPNVHIPPSSSLLS